MTARLEPVLFRISRPMGPMSYWEPLALGCPIPAGEPDNKIVDKNTWHTNTFVQGALFSSPIRANMLLYPSIKWETC